MSKELIYKIYNDYEYSDPLTSDIHYIENIILFLIFGYPNEIPKIGVSKKYFKYNNSKINNSCFYIDVSSLKIIGKTGEINNNDINKILNFVKINKDIIIQYFNAIEFDTIKIVGQISQNTKTEILKLKIDSILK